MAPYHFTSRFLMPALFTILLSKPHLAHANHNYYSVSMNDSLVADEHSAIVFNNIYLANRSNKTLPLHVSVSYPAEWKLIGQQHIEIILSPGAEEIVPLSFSKLPATKSEWQPVTVRIFRKHIPDTATFRFYLFSEEKRKFMLSAGSDMEVPVTPNERIKTLRATIGNQGNTPGRYLATWKNDLFRINETVVVNVAPGRDTTIDYSFEVPRDEMHRFNTEMVNCSVKEDATGRSTSIFYKINNVSSYKKAHSSAYKTADVNISTGLMNYGDEAITYYFGASGSVSFNDTSYLSFNYRSKQYGIMNMYEKNVLNISMRLGRWSLDAGQINDSRYFLTYGNTLKLGYRGEKTELSAWVSKHYQGTYYTNDHGGASVRYKAGSMKVEHTVAVNTDDPNRLTSAIVDNQVCVLDRKRISLNVSVGAGAEHVSDGTALPRSQNYGLSAGYSARYSPWDNLHVYSSMLKNSNDYPGIYRGQEKNYHEVRWSRKRVSLSGFYQYNAIARNYFRDTLFNTDIFTYNTERYGVRGGITSKRTGLLVSTGVLIQNGLTSVVPRHHFAEVHYRITGYKDFSLNLTSINTFGKGDGGDDVLGTNTNIFARYRGFGLNAIYVRAPIAGRRENVPGKTVYSETLNISPQISHTFFQTLSVGINYNYSKFLNNEMVTQYVGGNISYHGKKNGLSVNLNTSLPLQSTENDNYAHFYNVNYFTLTLSKELDIPLIHKRKYFDIGVELFGDINGNGRKDKDEHPVQNAQLTINEVPFRTDNEGKVFYRNVAKGDYKVALSRNNKTMGQVPARGYVIDTLLDRKTNISIAYKQAKVVHGRVNIIQDTNKNNSLTPDRIKVILRGGDEELSTITDGEGRFSFNVPSGLYTVSLNKAAFGEEFRPDRFSYTADLREKESETIVFTIKQKEREVRIKTFEL